MIFHENVPDIDRERIKQGLDDIKKYGDKMHKVIANFIEDTGIVIFLDLASKVGGSGSVQLNDQKGAIRAVKNRDLPLEEAARYVRLNIARETIDTGGQRGIEGTFVHEGKHALDFAQMLSTFSRDHGQPIFNPTAFQKEYSAHLTSAFYLMRRGGEYAAEGLSLGLLEQNEGRYVVSLEGIRNRLKRNYGLSPETPGKTLDTAAYPPISRPRKKWLGIF